MELVESGDAGSQPAVETEVSGHENAGEEAGSPPVARVDDSTKDETQQTLQPPARVMPESEKRIRSLVKTNHELEAKLKKYEEDLGRVERGEHEHVTTHIQARVKEEKQAMFRNMTRFIDENGGDSRAFWKQVEDWEAGQAPRQAPQPGPEYLTKEQAEKIAEEKYEAKLREREEAESRTSRQAAFENDVKRISEAAGVTSPRALVAVKELARHIANEDWKTAQEMGETKMPHSGPEYIEMAVRELFPNQAKPRPTAPTLVKPTTGRAEAKDPAVARRESVQRRLAEVGL